MKLAWILTEGLEQDYYIAKTTDVEVEELLLRGHYLGAWPFAGSQFKNYIYGIYLKRTAKQLPLVPLLPNEQQVNDDVLVGCIVYGLAEPHASGYVSKWVRGLLSPDDSIDDIYNNIRMVITKDSEEEQKAKIRGYPFKPKARTLIHNILNATNVQDTQILELKRLYILPKFDQKNIESFSIAKGNAQIFDNNPHIQVVVSFSDSRVGHHGGVYQATNAVYAGKTKRGLHRYLYLRDTLAATIKKYQKEYERLVFQYPKQGEIQPTKQNLNKYPVEMSKRDRIVSRHLRSILPKVAEPTLKAAIQKVLDMIEKSPQQTFQFKEVASMVIKEYLTESLLKRLNEEDYEYEEKMGEKWGLRDMLSDTKRDISNMPAAWQKGYKKIQRDKKWAQWNNRITDLLGRMGSSLIRR